jgi:hypothetical protein
METTVEEFSNLTKDLVMAQAETFAKWTQAHPLQTAADIACLSIAVRQAALTLVTLALKMAVPEGPAEECDSASKMLYRLLDTLFPDIPDPKTFLQTCDETPYVQPEVQPHPDHASSTPNVFVP